MRGFIRAISVFTLIAASTLASAEKSVVIEEDGGTVSGVVTGASPGVMTGRITQRRVLTCSQVRAEAAAYRNMVERIQTSDPRYQSLYYRMQRYERVLVYECDR